MKKIRISKRKPFGFSSFARMVIALAVISTLMLTGCATKSTEGTVSSFAAVDNQAGAGDTTIASAAGSSADEAQAESSVPAQADFALVPTAELRIGSLKGPTTIGLLHLMADIDSGKVSAPYSFVMETDPSALSAKVVSGEVDVALVPANLAAVLYNKTKGGVVALNINTLGVLDCVSSDESVNHISDLAGKTVLMTGQGATPEYALRYLLNANGVTDCTISFAAEATEIAARLKEEEGLIAILPQPFATSALMQNEKLSRRFSLTDEWASATEDSVLVTGVTIMRKEVLNAIGVEEANLFTELQSTSIAQALEDQDLTATLAVKQEIIAKEQIAKAALPFCGLPTDKDGGGLAIRGPVMEKYLSGYLQTLYDADPASVGGQVPDEGFYFK